MAGCSSHELRRLIAKSAVADSNVTRWLNMQLERRSEMESTTKVHVCHMAQFVSKVGSMQAQAAEDEHSEFELDPLWHSLPMKVVEQWCCAEHTSRAAAFIMDCSSITSTLDEHHNTCQTVYPQFLHSVADTL